MEVFEVVLCNEKLAIDELPVAKIKTFPDSMDINHNILSQGRIFYVYNEGLYIRLWIFQTEKSKENGKLSFYLNNNDKKLFVSIDRSGNVEACLDDENISNDIETEKFVGEDLEGEYWGAEIFLSETFLKKAIKNFEIYDGCLFMGNLSSYVHTHGYLFSSEYGVFKIIKW